MANYSNGSVADGGDYGARARPTGRSTESIKRLCTFGRQRPVVAVSRLWELDNESGRVLGQRRGTSDNEKWSGRLESNPHGRRFQGSKTSGLARWRIPSVMGV
jgi:hypothetical protein